MPRNNKKFGKREKPEFEQKLLDLARVTRVVKGGRRFRFRATVVIGNRRGKVGVGVSKGADVSVAMTKAYNDAKKNMLDVKMDGSTISHDVYQKLGSARVMLKPATEGRGIERRSPDSTRAYIFPSACSRSAAEITLPCFMVLRIMASRSASMVASPPLPRLILSPAWLFQYRL